MHVCSTPKLSAESTFHYKNKSHTTDVANEIIYSIDIPYLICKEWHDQAASSFPNGYTDIIYNLLIKEYRLTIDKHNHRLGNILRYKCSTIAKKLKSAKNKSKHALLKKSIKVNIFKNDLVSADMGVMDKLDVAEYNLAVANTKISNLEEEDMKLHSEVIELEKSRESLKENLFREKYKSSNYLLTNLEMQRYIENLSGISVDSTGMTGDSKKDFCKFSRNSQFRQLKELKSRAECALWFLKSFGLKLDNMILTDNNGKKHDICYSSIASISNSQRGKVENVLFILDHFYVSDASYHELSILSNGGLPKSYIVKQLRKDLNTICPLQRTPVPGEGAEIDAEEEIKFAVKSFLVEHPDVDSRSLSFGVKFCGDGTNFSRKSGMCVMSFCLFSKQVPEEKQPAHHAIAIVKGQESYDLYRVSFANVWKSINSLHERGSIEVDGISYKLNVFLGADYKFLLMVLGMSGATSNHACIYCEIPKSDRCDMSKPENYYNGPDSNLARTISKMQSSSLTQVSGCKNLPLVNLPHENIVVDELHLLLRITDRLTENIIQDVRDLDCKKKLGAVRRTLNSPLSHLTKLVHAIRSCGVSFRVWETIDANGKGTGRIEFTSLIGDEKKKMLRLLPKKLIENDILHPDTRDVTVKLWNDFAYLYNTVSRDCDETPVDNNECIFELARDWVTCFLSLEGRRKGFERERVTPYMHILVYHLPRLYSLHAGIKKFSAQGMEKLNDVAKSIHKQHSNKIDACCLILRTCWRQRHLSNQKRSPHSYKKKNDEYWGVNGEIFSKRRRIMPATIAESTVSTSVTESMSLEEVKARLKDLGVDTGRTRSEKKLRHLLKCRI